MKNFTTALIEFEAKRKKRKVKLEIISTAQELNLNLKQQRLKKMLPVYVFYFGQKKNRKIQEFLRYYRRVGAMVQETATSTGGLGFYSQAGQIGHSVAHGSPMLGRFFGVRSCVA